MPQPGDVVTVDFPGALATKRHPAVVVSSHTYHRTRPDVIVGILTSQVDKATSPTDFVLQDWKSAGLRNPSAFRTFLNTLPVASVQLIGHLSAEDWRQVHKCLALTIAIKKDE